MGELARQRRARQLWVSRGHVAAACVLAALLCVISFGVGYGLGRDGRAMEVAEQPEGIVADVPDEQLLDLLARLDTLPSKNGGVEVLKATEQLREEAAPGTPRAPLGKGVANPMVDPRPAGAYTIHLGDYDDREARELQAALRDRHIVGYRSSKVTAGRVSVAIAVGGFASEQAATQELERIRGTLLALGVDGPSVQALTP
ncbi:MAG: SPOR domain-containing protein [Myxococcales bacterium]|nr:SPOR domain-containing protein [Myxococcales bacterium]